MCLEIDREKTKTHGEVVDEWYKFYKIFIVKDNKLLTIFKGGVADTKEVIADGDIDIKDNEIHGGVIHAHYEFKRARTDHILLSHMIRDVILLPVNVHSDDIVAYGLHSDVCFFKYHFADETVNQLEDMYSIHFKSN